MNRLITFDTAHHALWAEEVAKNAGVAAEVVPAPEHSDAKCGLALEVLPEGLDDLLAALDKEGITYRVNA